MKQSADLLSQFYTNPLLFGAMADTHVVAVEIASDKEIELFKRVDRRIERERRKIRLFALLANRELMHQFHGQYELRELVGDFHFRFLAEFTSLAAIEAFKHHLRHTAAAISEYQIASDSIEQHLMLSQSTSFLKMRFDDLRRMQIAVEVTADSNAIFPAASRDRGGILALAITDSDGFAQVLSAHAVDEKTLLEEFVRIVRERDPDVIEGHHLLRSTLEFLESRARRHRISLALGRDGQMLHGRAARMQVAERNLAYRRYQAYGRNLVDTWLLAHHYDISSRGLESFELDEVARHFGLQRTGEDDEAKGSDPQRLEADVLDRARLTAALAASLSASYFIQAQIFPYSYQNVILRGNATKIDALLLRAYLARSHSVPAPSQPAEFGGGYSEMRRCGIAHNVHHCDVASLYPSLMIEGGHAPARDRLGVFLAMLADLRSFRLQAKSALREAIGGERRNLEALQQTFKILINSFYGYLGFSLGHFNDFAQADTVTRRGRELIRRAIAELEARGAEVIEVDTDGIYFTAPPGRGDEKAVEQLIDEISASMPPGIRLELDGLYRAMLSYKMKNYVLLDEQGELTIRGSGLKSRGLELFQRTFMEELFRLLLEGRSGEARQLFETWRRRIEGHQLGIRALMKTETLQDSLQTYQQKRRGKNRNAAAAYELALKSPRLLSSGEQISYYVTGSNMRVKVADAAKLAAEYDPAHPDENVAYYLTKLADLYEKFRPFVEHPELRLAISRDSTEAASSGQSELFAELVGPSGGGQQR